MRRARFTVGAAWGLLAVTASVGCASHNVAASRASLAATGSTSAARLEGVWEGEVWERPSYYNQGVRRIATFETSFKGRTVAAMIGLYRVGRRVAEAAEAVDER
jgi:hypothetical protein